jgi:hypothetical protein
VERCAGALEQQLCVRNGALVGADCGQRPPRAKRAGSPA